MANQTFNWSYLRAVAFCVGLVATLSGSTRADTPGDLELARKIIEGFKDQDAKLRTAYRELGVQQTKTAALVAKRQEKDAHQAKTVLARQESQFKKDQGRLLSRLDDEAIPAIRQLGGGGTKAVADLIRFTEMFVFDPKTEVADIHVSLSFSDQASWREAAKSIGKIGVTALPELKKALASPQAPVRYAAALALGEIGPAVDQEDKNIYSDIAGYYTKVRGSSLERTEKDRRGQILQDAMEKIRPPKK